MGEENRRGGVKESEETAVKRANGGNDRCMSIRGSKGLVSQLFHGLRESFIQGMFCSSLDNRQAHFIMNN